MVAAAVVGAESDERARWLAAPSALSFLRLRSGRPGPLPSPEEAAAYPYTELDQAIIGDRQASSIIGSPETVRKGLEDLLEATRADELMITTTTFDPADRVRSFELVAQIAGHSHGSGRRAGRRRVAFPPNRLPRVRRRHMRYLVRERVFSIGDDFWITDEQGNRVFLVDGKALRLRATFELKDADGSIVATVKKKLIALRDTMEIEHDGAVVATVRKAMISPLHHRSVIDLADGSQLEAVGNLVDKEFDILAAGQPIAHVSRAWFRLRDTYGVDVAPGQNDALMLAIAVCLDRIHHDEEEKEHH